MFFSSVASLMSVLLRRCVVNTLYDLLAFFELKIPGVLISHDEHSEENGKNNTSIHRIKIFLVKFYS